jgi:phosphatidylinositol kinase/protein kinase (PI-3  family)
LNDETNARVARLRNELLGDATAIQIARLRDSLLSAKTADAVKAIVDSALSGASRFLKTDLRQGIDSNVSIIQKYAVRWLLLLAAIATAIIFLVWRNRQKYLKMTTLLASQIHAIPDQKTYNEITSRIKTKAIESGVEPSLNKVLKENGILGKEKWKADQEKKGAVNV